MLTFALVLVTVFFIDGFDITTVDATTLNDGDKSDLLDRYKSRSAVVAGLTPVLLPHFLWGRLGQDTQSKLTSWIAVAIGLALAWALVH